MNGNMLYHKYIVPNNDYFSPHKSLKHYYNYNLTMLPKGCLVEFDTVGKNPWKQYLFPNKELPNQGWKIHITTPLECAQELLEDVAYLLFEEKVIFKHIKNKKKYIELNAKNANRAYSGKFITIYPETNSQFLRLLDLLKSKVDKYPSGPYILNDKQWKGSNVFYRYGAFKKILNELGEYCIYDENQNLIIDQRKPYYYAPNFVKEFDLYLDSINKLKAKKVNDSGNLDSYTINKSLSFSNAGGVYQGFKNDDGLKVVIKEARPKAGLDSSLRDAIERQEIEKKALIQLKHVSGVVNLYDCFKQWEHTFLVEEHIAGKDLSSWIEEHFPYKNTSKTAEYSEKVEILTEQLIDTVEEIHKKGLAMGDIQPANILITCECNLKLIDFETALPVDSTLNPSMMTVGFGSNKVIYSASRDWYGVLKIIKFLTMPIFSSEVMDEYLNINYYEWLKESYSLSFYEYVVKMHELCISKINQIERKTVLTIQHNSREFKRREAVEDIIDSLLNGLEENLTSDERLINGDIRQFELDNGKINFLNGGSGAAFTLLKNNKNNNKVTRWIKDHVLHSFSDIEDEGLLTGKAGIAVILYEAGYKKVATGVLDQIFERTLANKSLDFTVRSGLTGIGLVLISLYVETKNEEYLKKVKELIEKIEDIKFHDSGSESKKDWSIVNKGFVDGFSGVATLYSLTFAFTDDTYYLEKAIYYLNKDIELHKNDSDETVFENQKPKPASQKLSSGLIGVGIAIWCLNHVTKGEYFEHEFNEIQKLTKNRLFFSGGLFEGAGGFLLLPTITEDISEYGIRKENALKMLSVFLIKRKDYYVYPGQFSYRLSDDVFSGSSGVILALTGMTEKNPLNWLPLINTHNVINQSRKN